MSEKDLTRELIELKAKLKTMEELAIEKSREAEMAKAKLSEARQTGKLEETEEEKETSAVELLVAAEQRKIPWTGGELSVDDAKRNWETHRKKTLPGPS